MARQTPRDGQALPPLREVFAGRDPRWLSLLDVGCGTGRFLDLSSRPGPAPAIGSIVRALRERSEASFERWSRINLVVANGESIPVPDEKPRRGDEHLYLSRNAARRAPHCLP